MKKLWSAVAALALMLAGVTPAWAAVIMDCSSNPVIGSEGPGVWYQEPGRLTPESFTATDGVCQQQLTDGIGDSQSYWYQMGGRTSVSVKMFLDEDSLTADYHTRDLYAGNNALLGFIAYGGEAKIRWQDEGNIIEADFTGTLNAWHLFSIVLELDETWSYYVDGLLFGNGFAGAGTTGVVKAGIGGYNQSRIDPFRHSFSAMAAGPLDFDVNVAYFDDFGTVDNAIPSPGTASLASLALLGVVLTRRRAAATHKT